MNVIYFARIREVLGVDSEELDIAIFGQGDVTVAHLKQWLCLRGDQWQQALGDRSVLVAIDQEYGSDESIIDDHSEVAFFPPVTGG